MSETGSFEGAINRIRNYIDDGGFEAELATRVTHRTESQKLPDRPQQAKKRSARASPVRFLTCARIHNFPLSFALISAW